MKRRNIVILIAVLFFIVVAIAYAIYAVWDSKHGGIVFPVPASGQEYIVKTPIVTQEKNGTVKIDWSISKKCKNNYIYLHEYNDKNRSGQYSGYNVTGDEDCDGSSGIFACEAIVPDCLVLVSGKKYLAQVNSEDCGDDTDVAGSVFSFVTK